MVQVKLTDLSDPFRQIIRFVSKNTCHRSEIGRSLSNDDTELAKVAAQGVDELGALPHKALVSTKCHGPSLMFGALNLDKMHVWTLRSLRDRRCINLLPFDERLHVDRRDQSHVVATASRQPAPEMTGSTGLHRDDARRLLVQKLLQTSSRKNPVE